jgi:hypothetical protein
MFRLANSPFRASHRGKSSVLALVEAVLRGRRLMLTKEFIDPLWRAYSKRCDTCRCAALMLKRDKRAFAIRAKPGQSVRSGDCLTQKVKRLGSGAVLKTSAKAFVAQGNDTTLKREAADRTQSTLTNDNALTELAVRSSLSGRFRDAGCNTTTP